MMRLFTLAVIALSYLSKLDYSATLVIKTFKEDYTILNKEKYQLLMCDHSSNSVWAKNGVPRYGTVKNKNC